MTQLSNRTLFTGDNLPVLRGLNSDSVDLIYLDPPFNSNKDYSAPIGSEAAGAHFKDAWTLDDVDAEWHGQIADEHPGAYKVIDAAGIAHSKGMQAYLIMMAVRMIEMQRILCPTGSIYLHVDPTASHYLKTLMDSIFGRAAYRNEIIWAYRRLPAKQENFQRMHDVVLRYAGEGATWNQLYDDPAPSTVKQHKGRKRVRVIVDGKRMPDAYTEIKSAGPAMRDVWNISVLHPSAKERVGYPTQKPLSLLERIIRASSNEGDYVFDPFCGCATTLVAAEKLSRKWGGRPLRSSGQARQAADQARVGRLALRCPPPHGHPQAHGSREAAQALRPCASTLRRAGGALQGLPDTLPVPRHACRSHHPASGRGQRRIRQSSDAVLRLQCPQGHRVSPAVARPSAGGRNPAKVSVHMGLATFVYNPPRNPHSAMTLMS